MTRLSKDQQNEIFRALASKVNPAEFELYGSDRSQTTIRHVPSESVIVLTTADLSDGFSGSILRVQTRIGYDPEREQEMAASFRAMLSQISMWAADVSKWVETPDLWALSRAGKNVPGDLAPESANTPFTPDEQKAISAQLKAIAESVKKAYNLTAEQSANLDEKFEEAEKASQRMGRKDWGMFFGGALLSLILCDAITPEIMGHILMMVQHGIGNLFMGSPPSVHGILSVGGD
jgi:hypothetical protein